MSAPPSRSKKKALPWDKPAKPQKKPPLAFEDLDQGRIDDTVDAIVAYIGEGKEAHEEEIVAALAYGDDDEARGVLLVLAHLAKTGALDLVNVEEAGRTPGRYYFNGERATPAHEAEAQAEPPIAVTSEAPPTLPAPEPAHVSRAGSLGLIDGDLGRMVVYCADCGDFMRWHGKDHATAANWHKVYSEKKGAPVKVWTCPECWTPKQPPVPGPPVYVVRPKLMARAVERPLEVARLLQRLDEIDPPRAEAFVVAIVEGANRAAPGQKSAGGWWTRYAQRRARLATEKAKARKKKASRDVVAVRFTEEHFLELQREADRRGTTPGLLLRQTWLKTDRVGLSADLTLAGRTRWLVDHIAQTEPASSLAARCAADLGLLLGGVEPVAPPEPPSGVGLRAEPVAPSEGVLVPAAVEAPRTAELLDTRAAADLEIEAVVRFIRAAADEEEKRFPTHRRSGGDQIDTAGQLRNVAHTISQWCAPKMLRALGALRPEPLATRLNTLAKGIEHGAHHKADHARAAAPPARAVLEPPGSAKPEPEPSAPAAVFDPDVIVDDATIARLARRLKHGIHHPGAVNPAAVSYFVALIRIAPVSAFGTWSRADLHALRTSAGTGCADIAIAFLVEVGELKTAGKGKMETFWRTPAAGAQPPRTSGQTPVLDPHQQEERAAAARRKVLDATREKPRTRFEITHAAGLHMDAVTDAVATLSAAGKLRQTMRRRGQFAAEEQYQAAT